MKPIVYGKKTSENKMKSELRILLLFHLLLIFSFYPFLVLVLRLPLPVYGFWIYMILHLMIVILWKQKKENKEYVLFDEKAIHIYTYTKWLYRDILLHKEPKETILPYQDITACNMTYHETHKKSKYLYCVRFHLISDGTHRDLDINLAWMSEKNLRQLLMLLARSITHFEDPYELYLCLLQQYVAFDTYVERIKGRECI